MKIIISPAKKMNVDTDTLPWRDLPVFLDRTQVICDILKGMAYDQLKNLWKCNDQIAAMNVQRLEQMQLHGQLTPALLAYEGIQYQYMAPGVFTQQDFDYVQKHLRILSGFYGVLRPFDGVTPYRLEMRANLKIGQHKNLYSYWGNSIAKEICSEADCIINLASKEYSLCVSRFLPDGVRFITCTFGEEKDGKIIEKGTICKMARGEMVRYMAEHQITDSEKIKDFDCLNYRYAQRYSNDSTFVFLLDKK